MFLPFASRTGSTHWRQFDVEQRSKICFPSTLLPHRVPRQFVSPSAPGDLGRLGTLRIGGMSSAARAPWDESCSPVPAADCRALGGAAHQSPHGFADGYSGCQGTSSLPALFVCFWLHRSHCSAKRPRALLHQDLGNPISDVSHFPQLESLFQLADTLRDFSKEQATPVAAERCPGLVTARAPSRLSAQAVAYRETTHHGSAIAEARRSSDDSDGQKKNRCSTMLED